MFLGNFKLLKGLRLSPNIVGILFGSPIHFSWEDWCIPVWRTTHTSGGERWSPPPSSTRYSWKHPYVLILSLIPKPKPPCTSKVYYSCFTYHYCGFWYRKYQLVYLLFWLGSCRIREGTTTSDRHTVGELVTPRLQCLLLTFPTKTVGGRFYSTSSRLLQPVFLFHFYVFIHYILSQHAPLWRRHQLPVIKASLYT